MMYKNNIVIVFGNDHSNTVSVIQSLGKEGFSVIALLWGKKTGLVKSSKYTKLIIVAQNEILCLRKIIEAPVSNEIVPIIPCSDDAARALFQLSSELEKRYVFQYPTKGFSISDLQNKSFQDSIAKEAGLNVPETWIVNNINDIKQIEIRYPLIIKPLISSEGAKSDIRICENEDELYKEYGSLLHTKKVLIQTYIQKEHDMLIYGCSNRDGSINLPGFIIKERLYPQKTGLGIINSIRRIEELDKYFIDACRKYIEEVGYVGLFSLEFAYSKKDQLYYFIESNFRNDGTNAVYTKAGANLPKLHVLDLLKNSTPKSGVLKTITVIFEMNLFMSVVKKQTSIKQLLKDLKRPHSYKLYYPEDKKPFFKQFVNLFMEKFRLFKQESYE